MSQIASQRKSCLFCGSTDRKITKQHIFSQQLRGVFKGIIGETGTSSIRSGINSPIEFSSPPFADKVGGFCEQCNSTWMQVIEARAIQILKPMITGGFPQSLSRDDQQSLATWALLTALVLDHQAPQNRVVPDAEYSMFHLNRTPQLHHLIWIGRTDPRVDNLVVSTRKGRVKSIVAQNDPVFIEEMRKAMADHQWIYVFTFSLGFVVFQVAGHNLTVNLGVNVGEVHSKVMTRIWSPQDEFEWRLADSVSTIGGLGVLHEMFTGVVLS